MRIFRSQEVPWFVVEVCRALEQVETPLPHGAELGLVEAVADALAWATDPRPYDPHFHDRSWATMATDFDATIRRVSRKGALGILLGDDFAAVRRCIATPPSEVDPQLVRGGVEAALEVLSARIMEGETIRAAWLDLIKACGDPGVDEEDWAWRRNLFVTLMANSGRAVPTIASALCGVLDNTLLEVTMARVFLGQQVSPGPGNWPSLDVRADLSESEQLELCEQLVQAQPTLGHCIVCVGFDHALASEPVTIGSTIGVYSAKDVNDLIGKADAPEPLLLIPPDAMSHIPTGDDEVIAVINLGIAAPALAVTDGAANLEAMVALVNYRLRTPLWRPMRGYILIVDGKVASTTDFHRSDEGPRRPWVDPTWERVEQLGERVAQHLPVTNPLLRRVVEASQSLLDAQAGVSDPGGRLLLLVRIVEEAAAWGNTVASDSWDFAARFRESWAQLSTQEDIFRFVSDSIGGSFANELFLDEASREELKHLRALIMPEYPARGDLCLQPAVANLGRLVDIYPSGCGPRRKLATLNRRWKSAPALAKHFGRRSADYDLLLNRARRCRDAAAHGGPVPKATAASVIEWARVVATSALRMALDALLEDTSNNARRAIAVKHQEAIDVAATRHASLVSGDDIMAVVFPDTGPATKAE